MIVNVAPTPAVPLLYVPPRAAVVATLTDFLIQAPGKFSKVNVVQAGAAAPAETNACPDVPTAVIAIADAVE